MWFFVLFRRFLASRFSCFVLFPLFSCLYNFKISRCTIVPEVQRYRSKCCVVKSIRTLDIGNLWARSEIYRSVGTMRPGGMQQFEGRHGFEWLFIHCDENAGWGIVYRWSDMVREVVHLGRRGSILIVRVRLVHHCGVGGERTVLCTIRGHHVGHFAGLSFVRQRRW